MSDFCFVLGCHDKIQELLCHLEILTFCPFPYDVIVSYSGSQSLPEVDILKNVLVIPTENCGHRPPLGATLAFFNGMVAARRPPLPYVQHTFNYMCYRNCDDWLFNYKHVTKTLEILKTTNKKIAGYNWLDQNVFTNLALNELFIKMSILEGVDLSGWVPYFKERIIGICEKVVGEKLFNLINLEDFHRFTERESETGIGIYAKWQHNSRFWNEEWLLVGHHNQGEKRQLYRHIRNRIPYADELEQKEHFKAWLK